MQAWINEAGWDRAARILTGAVLLGVAYFAAAGTARAVLVVLGVLALATGVTGFCPAYRLLGVNTCRVAK